MLYTCNVFDRRDEVECDSAILYLDVLSVEVAFVSWTTMPWLMRAGGVLAMVAVAAVAYFAVMFACGWRLSDLRPGRGDD